MKVWAGRILSGLTVLFLLWDGVMKMMRPSVVLESWERLGYAQSVSVGIGLLELICVAVYAFPPTSVLGSILMTGFLGGAVATHVRVGDPLFTHVLFPTYIGALLWLGLYLRDDRLRTLVPLRKQQAGTIP